MVFFCILLFANSGMTFMLAGDFAAYHASHQGGLTLYLLDHPPYLMLLFNGGLIATFLLLRKEYMLPAETLIEEADRLQMTVAGMPKQRLSFRRIAHEFAGLIRYATSLARDHELLKRSLSSAQMHIEQLMQAQRRLSFGAYNETVQVFSTIQSYAHYLEDMVLAKRADEAVRYDYDEVYEAAHNLQFLMQGMTFLLQRDMATIERECSLVDTCTVLGQFLVKITPALERRAMRITSERFPANLSLYTHDGLLRHVLWAMLYVCMRYAEDDSTLNIEGRDSKDHVTLRFFVTHSNPAALSTGERAAYLSALTNSDNSVHMFAHALSQHPNMQLASKLAALLKGTIDCVPQGPYCCMLELNLPKLSVAGQ